MTLRERLAARLRTQEEHGLLRRLWTTSAADPGIVHRNGARLQDFSSNDYLALSRHPEVISAAQDALSRHGAGARASRLISGEHPLLGELEAAFAALKGVESCLLFPSGYQANLTVLSSLVNSRDALFLDRRAHACLVEGARLTRARTRVFRHQALDKLREDLQAHRDYPARWIVTDAVYSMDGSLSPVKKFLQLAEEEDAVLILDDAHGTGVLGGGSGTTEHLGIVSRDYPDRLIVTATLSKALGSQGGAVLGSDLIREYLVNFGKGFIYSTGPAPANAAAALAAIRILRERALPEMLASRVLFFRGALAERGIAVSTEDPTPIVPIIVGTPEDAMCLSARLQEGGILGVAIRPPTVPAGSSRVRLSVTLSMEEHGLLRAADVVDDSLKQLRLQTIPPGETP